MTEEQLEWFTKQTERAVRVGLRPAIAKARRRDQKTFFVGYIILLIGLIVALWLPGQEAAKSREAIVDSGRAVAVESCNRDYVSRQADRALLQQARRTTLRRTDITPERRAASIAFYDQQLKLFVLPDCRRSESLLTANPDRKIPRIQPYYEGGPNVPAITSLNPGG